MARGRPKKEFGGYAAVVDGSLDAMQARSTEIADTLQIGAGTITDRLAEISFQFEAAVQAQAKVKAAHQWNKARGIADANNRKGGPIPKISVAAMLKDIALLVASGDASTADAELRKLGGWSEDSGTKPAIVEYAEAVLTVTGEPVKSLRRQIRNAVYIETLEN